MHQGHLESCNPNHFGLPVLMCLLWEEQVLSDFKGQQMKEQWG